MNYDVFNGDADGIIALIQLRLSSPKKSTLVTGVKRDIGLLKQVKANHGDVITVLDISMEKNIEALKQVIDDGASVFYADHHRSGDIPTSENLDAHIDLDANTCTSLIIDNLLNGQYRNWAITAAYGDNLFAKADELCLQQGLSSAQSEQLKELGTLINYNGYGSTVSDLHYEPAKLFEALLVYSCPFDVFEDHSSPFYKLKTAYESDFENAKSIAHLVLNKKLAIFELPNTVWAKRISGVYGNYLANQSPDLAHAVLTDNNDETYTVSLRAPLANKQGAGDICSQFDTGGGRSAAAGVNRLPKEKLNEFIDAIYQYY
ncbi:DHH family phosphoesterase [Shewanella sp. TC10]|uniref:DHH family phosphoesterase n=1 Tax=Shewanella sp. TC10 TaxID=1419739 RepID=UPI00129DF199|nr:DHH family phosphoesterase [Shewanella sp. TC10]